MDVDNIRLTHYSHGAGCGCKISPSVLDKILHTGSDVPAVMDKALIVGNDKRDDAAVLDIGAGMGLISTTDFFMPIVDDPYDFGRIAAANAISDVYAMGGKPVLALAILGWPIDKLPPEVAGRVLDGARSICAEAGITLAGGHSIDALEPVFGLSVNGMVSLTDLKLNASAEPGCQLFLTKPLGVGVLSTAQKKNLLTPEDAAISLASMTKLNKIGYDLGKIPAVKAMTDVTGFGLLGHLTEVCQGSGVTAVIEFDKVPYIASVPAYLEKGCVPGGTARNLSSYGNKIGPLSTFQRQILADPQTSGGLLVAVAPDGVETVTSLLKEHGIEPIRIGALLPANASKGINSPIISVV